MTYSEYLRQLEEILRANLGIGLQDLSLATVGFVEEQYRRGKAPSDTFTAIYGSSVPNLKAD